MTCEFEIRIEELSQLGNMMPLFGNAVATSVAGNGASSANYPKGCIYAPWNSTAQRNLQGRTSRR